MRQTPEGVAVESLVVPQKEIRQPMGLGSSHQLAIRPARTQGSPQVQLQTLW